MDMIYQDMIFNVPNKYHSYVWDMFKKASGAEDEDMDIGMGLFQIVFNHFCLQPRVYTGGMFPEVYIPLYGSFPCSQEDLINEPEPDLQAWSNHDMVSSIVEWASNLYIYGFSPKQAIDVLAEYGHLDVFSFIHMLFVEMELTPRPICISKLDS